MAIDIKKNQLSDEEYIRILGFVYDLWNEGEGRQHILNCLNNWFGCVCSSFWMVENNQQMVKPVGAKISESLLEDYEKEFYLQDSIYNVQKNSAFFSDKVVEENENPFMEGEALTPYKERLQAEGIWHRFSIFLRENGKIIGTIALFDSILSPPQ